MTTSTTGKNAAAQAAKALLAERIALVEQLGAAIDVHRRKVQAIENARSAEQDAAQKVRAAYTAAQAGGWTATELKQAGLVAPAAPRSPRPQRKATVERAE